MDKRDDRFELPLVPVSENNSRVWVEETVTYRAPAKVPWNWTRIIEKSVDVGLCNHCRSAGHTRLRLADSNVPLDHRCQDVFLVFQNIEDSGLVHSFVVHHLAVYTGGGLDGFPD